jgi:D-alanyl-D-alanine carboxypeptidase/D-alanyl-D-alanine-endopeptidase (penicillin-binding protein 4)
MSPTRTFAVVVALGAVVCAAAAFVGSDSVRAAGPPVPSLATPLWSPRRVPQPIVEGVGAQRLQTSLDQALVGDNSCYLVDEGGAPLASHGIDAALVPASTQKLVTVAVALSILGPDAHLETRALASSAPDGGQVERLWMVGGGDPTLVTPDAQALRDETPELRGSKTTQLTALADSIVAAGVKKIPGGIVGDDTRYENLRYLPSWKDSYRTDGEIGPIGALTVNSGFSALKPKPVPVSDPAQFAAQKLQELLEARGVSVGKSATSGQAPPDAVEVGKVDSAPLSDVVSEVLTTSDNLGAEMLTREIGVRVSHQGTTAAGTQAIVAQLTSLGLPTANVTLIDGSGLDRGNRVTCQLLAGVLDLGSRPQFAALWTGLPVAAQSGTLVEEFQGTALDGKARAKTGTLDGVTGLVGFIDVGHPLRFAFVANGEFSGAKAAIELRDLFASIAAKFPDAPPADQLVPAPSQGR